MFRRLADNRNPRSLASKMRRRRMEVFRTLLDPLTYPLRILDVGGTPRFWRDTAPDLLDRHVVTVANLTAVERACEIRCVQADARNMPQFADNSFDVVFSNSVIEHVGSWTDQQSMANEIRRVGARHFVQTPNYWFPLEPHMLFPGFQWLSVPTRIRILRHTSLAKPKRVTRAVAYDHATRIRLLTASELRQLFPCSQIVPERACGLVKSWMVHDFNLIRCTLPCIQRRPKRRATP